MENLGYNISVEEVEKSRKILTSLGFLADSGNREVSDTGEEVVWEPTLKKPQDPALPFRQVKLT